MIGTLLAILPTSSSDCIIRLIRATGKVDAFFRFFPADVGVDGVGADAGDVGISSRKLPDSNKTVLLLAVFFLGVFFCGVPAPSGAVSILSWMVWRLDFFGVSAIILLGKKFEQLEQMSKQ